jgi:hypothetical protein
MFRYKPTILREHSMPGLKPTASDKPLSTYVVQPKSSRNLNAAA